MHPLLVYQEKLKKIPFGQSILSYYVARNAPYFLSIRPKIIEARPNFIKASLKKRRKVENHLKTVHAIAMCNLCEFAGGICTEISIPKHLRWIPKGMQVNYVKKAKTNLTATCNLENVDWENTSELDCFVSVKDTNGIEVMNATITMKISSKK